MTFPIYLLNRLEYMKIFETNNNNFCSWFCISLKQPKYPKKKKKIVRFCSQPEYLFYNEVPYNEVPYNEVPYNEVPYNTILYNDNTNTDEIPYILFTNTSE